MKGVSRRLFRKSSYSQELQMLFSKQKGKCAYSGRELTLGHDATLDHRIPESKGGTSSIENLQWVHSVANQMKFDFDEDEFLKMVADIYHHRIASSR